MKKYGLLALILVMLLSMALPAFAADKVTMGLVVMSTNSEYWLAVKAGAERALNAVGGNLIFTGPADNADVQGQVARVEDLINRRVDAILLTPLNADALVAPVKKAIKAGIPVIIIDSAINWDGMTSFIATDNVAASRIAMQKLVDLIGGKGKVAIVNALAGIPSNDGRNIGAKQIVDKNPGVKLLPIQYSLDQAAAMQNTENIITANPDLKGIFGAFNRGALGAAQALINRSMAGKVHFVAFDADPDEIRLLKEGVIDALVVQQPFEMGRMGVEFALKAMKGARVPKLIHTPVAVVTRDNMNAPEIQKVLYPTK